MLIAVDALLRMPRPWFYFPGMGQSGLSIGEDAYFSQKCEDHGVETWCSTGHLVAHMARVFILPNRVVDEGATGKNGSSGRWDMSVDGISALYPGPPEKDETVLREKPRDPDPVTEDAPPVVVGGEAVAAEG